MTRDRSRVCPSPPPYAVYEERELAHNKEMVHYYNIIRENAVVRNATKNRHGEVQMENAAVSELPFLRTGTQTVN